MASNDLKIQVLMVGGRRCGKTSVLAAMKTNFENAFSQTNMDIFPDDLDTLDILATKNDEMKEYFIQAGNRTFVPDNNPTEDIMEYSFSVKISNKRNNLKVKFVDYPGEWLIDRSHRDKIQEYMENSQAILIAIDTPHMMEKDGLYNERKNYCNKIADRIKRAFEESSAKHPFTSGEHKLVLFVPLKCERYLADNRMDEVKLITEESYETLINFLKKNPKVYEVAITPIFTLGKAMFSQFERDVHTGEIKIDTKDRIPEKAIYYFPDDNAKKPVPKYCEQPIVYLIAYLMQCAGEKKYDEFSEKSLLGKLGVKMNEIFFNEASYKDYICEKRLIMQHLKQDGDGYQIIQNPLDFKKYSFHIEE